MDAVEVMLCDDCGSANDDQAFSACSRNRLLLLFVFLISFSLVCPRKSSVMYCAWTEAGERGEWGGVGLSIASRRTRGRRTVDEVCYVDAEQTVVVEERGAKKKNRGKQDPSRRLLGERRL